MDIHACIDHLKLNANQYRLDQSIPPHQIIEWHKDNPDPKPTLAKLKKAWSAIEGDIKWLPIRQQRDQLLRQSDWRMGNDSPLSESEQATWGTYRQALRDIPQDQSVGNVVYPELPA